MNKNFLSHKSGFTLVEMLIVIVIIGILASALIPRLSQARERANDTARRAHIQNVATVLIAYQIDRGSYPTTAGPISAIESQLVGAGLSSVPTDPDASRSFVGIAAGNNCIPSPAGQYMYTPIRKRGINNAGFVLMAGTQTEGGSNRVRVPSGASNPPYTSDGCISAESNFDLIVECQNFIQGQNPAFSSNGVGTCVYNQNQDSLRYIYRQ